MPLVFEQASKNGEQPPFSPCCSPSRGTATNLSSCRCPDLAKKC